MKLSEMIEDLEDGDLAEYELPGRYCNAIDALVAWAKKANEVLLIVEAVYSKSDDFQKEISSLIDTEVQ